MVQGETLLLGTTYTDWRARTRMAIAELRSRVAD